MWSQRGGRGEGVESDRDTAKCKLSKGITIQTTMGAEQKYMYHTHKRGTVENILEIHA